MQYLENCWAGCNEEFVVEAPDRQDPRLAEGVPVACTHCGEKYTFTVDGDGEPELASGSHLGDNIDDVREEDSTHF